MPHLDPEELSLLALYGEGQDEQSTEHLRTCSDCAAEYAALRRAVEAVKTSPDTSSLSTPGPHVWAGIHRELGLSEAVAQDPLRPAADGPTAAAPFRPTLIEGTKSEEPRGRTDLRSVSPWWRRPATWVSAAAAATLLIATGVLWTVNRAPQPLAQAELSPLAQHSATGTAKVVEAADGSRKLEIQLNKDEAQGYQEVWLIAPDLSRLVSLGVMNSPSGTFDVPTGLNLSDFPIVDVSDEPVDGNPAHSSISIVRGTLDT